MHPPTVPLPAEVERVRADVEPDVKALALHTDVLDGVLRHLAAILHVDGVLDQDDFWAEVARLPRPARRGAPGARRRRGGLRPASPHLPPLLPQPAPAAQHAADGATTSPTSPPRCSTPGAGQPGGPLRAGPAPTGRMARWGGRDTACCRCRGAALDTGSCAGSPAGRTRRTCRATRLHHAHVTVLGPFLASPRRRRDRAGAARGCLGGGLRGGAGAGGALPRRHAPPRAGARRALPRAHRATGRGLPAVPPYEGGTPSCTRTSPSTWPAPASTRTRCAATSATCCPPAAAPSGSTSRGGSRARPGGWPGGRSADPAVGAAVGAPDYGEPGEPRDHRWTPTQPPRTSRGVRRPDGAEGGPSTARLVRRGPSPPPASSTAPSSASTSPRSRRGARSSSAAASTPADSTPRCTWPRPSWAASCAAATSSTRPSRAARRRARPSPRARPGRCGSSAAVARRRSAGRPARRARPHRARPARERPRAGRPHRHGPARRAAGRASLREADLAGADLRGADPRGRRPGLGQTRQDAPRPRRRRAARRAARRHRRHRSARDRRLRRPRRAVVESGASAGVRASTRAPPTGQTTSPPASSPSSDDGASSTDQVGGSAGSARVPRTQADGGRRRLLRPRPAPRDGAPGSHRWRPLRAPPEASAGSAGSVGSGGSVGSEVDAAGSARPTRESGTSATTVAAIEASTAQVGTRPHSPSRSRKPGTVQW